MKRDDFVAVVVISAGLSSLLFARAQGPGAAPQAPAAPGAVRPVAPASGRGSAESAGTGVIRGRVVAADTGLPLRRAQVHLSGARLVPPTYPFVATDEQGRYEFPEIAAGRYTVTVTKAGYLTLSYGQQQAADQGRTVEVRGGETIERIDVALPKGGTIAVTVTDDFGGPIGRVHVQAERHSYSPQFGRRTLVSVGTGETNDRGDVRITGLPPGDYYISANAGFGRVNPALAASDSGLRYGEPTYFPGTIRASEAQPVRLSLGQEAVASLSLVPTHPVRLTGAVRSADGSVPQRARLALQQQFASSYNSDAIPIQGDGSFEISGVMPGEYVLSVRPETGGPANPVMVAGEYARLPLTVGGDDITGLVMTTTRATAVRGRLVFDTPPPASLRAGELRISVGGALGVGLDNWNDDWTFEITALAGAGTLRLAGAPAAAGQWFLKSVTFEGRDVTDVPTDFSRARNFDDLQVVVTSKGSQIGGTVTDSRNAPVSSYAVVAFPDDRARWSDTTRLIAVGRADQEGRFRILGLPAGRYAIAAVSALAQGEERDPELLSRLLRDAQRLTLSDGESKTVALKVD